MIEKLSTVESKKLLEERKFGHLACVLESGEPYVVPINFLFIDGSLYLHSLEGKKLAAMRSNGKVCLQVEEIKSDFIWQSAIVLGEFQEIRNAKEKSKLLLKFSESFERLTPVESLSESDLKQQEATVFRINIRQITGVGEN